ncbi:MAG: hypothetical protein NC098_02865 [Lachnoclostridium sp.]|nr:hypothetical protein [Lachnoclostridium sp.]
MAEYETKLKTLWVEIKDYISLNIDYAKLTVSERMAMLLTAASLCAIVFALVSLMMFFLSMALVRWIAESTGIVGAYLIMFGFYVILLAVVVVFRKAMIINPISRFISKLFFKP